MPLWSKCFIHWQASLSALSADTETRRAVTVDAVAAQAPSSGIRVRLMMISADRARGIRQQPQRRTELCGLGETLASRSSGRVAVQRDRYTSALGGPGDQGARRRSQSSRSTLPWREAPEAPRQRRLCGWYRCAPGPGGGVERHVSLGTCARGELHGQSGRPPTGWPARSDRERTTLREILQSSPEGCRGKG